MTNYEKIKSLSIDEMSAWILKIGGGGNVNAAEYCTLRENVRMWLEEEVFGNDQF